MPVVNVNLLVDDKVYTGIQTGILELCGMVKNADNKKVVKHLPTVADAAKDGTIKAVDFIRKHKKGTLIAGGVLIAVGVIGGTVGYISSRDKRTREKVFAENFQIYLDAAKEGKLTIDILSNLINSIESLEKGKGSESIDLKISTSQFSELIFSLFDYTKRFAEANDINTTLINKPKLIKKKDFSDLQYYLNLQKSIFEQIG